MKALLRFCILVAALFSVWEAAVFAKHTGNEGPQSKSFKFSYSFVVQNIPDSVKNLEIWVPLPLTDMTQRVSNLTIHAPMPYAIQTDADYGNQILYLNSKDKLPAEIRVSIDFTVERQEHFLTDSLSVSPGEAKKPNLSRYLAPDKLVPVDGKILAEAKQVVNDNMTTLEKARALYDHCVQTMQYDKSGTGWGRGDAIYACDVRKGNCTDIHSLFIGMARACGIPARFQIGFPIPADKLSGEISGYHCWAEFYLDGVGWVPIDASDAIKHPERSGYLFGNLDPDRVLFTIGRDIRVKSATEPVELNYLIYPYVRIDGKQWDSIDRKFTFTSTGSF